VKAIRDSTGHRRLPYPLDIDAGYSGLANKLSCRDQTVAALGGLRSGRDKLFLNQLGKLSMDKLRTVIYTLVALEIVMVNALPVTIFHYHGLLVVNVLFIMYAAAMWYAFVARAKSAPPWLNLAGISVVAMLSTGLQAMSMWTLSNLTQTLFVVVSAAVFFAWLPLQIRHRRNQFQALRKMR
jgi:hypothetical protein